MIPLPSLDEPASQSFTFRDLCECSQTWRLHRPDNQPLQPDTYDAMRRLAEQILEPIARRFGRPTLTYGFAGPALTRLVARRIAPSLDQHAGHELNRRGGLICPRLGQSADVYLPGLDAFELARFVSENTAFDRLYVYGPDRPVHVSCGPEQARARYLMSEAGGRLIPRPLP